MSKSFSFSVIARKVIFCLFICSLFFRYGSSLSCLKCESSEVDSDCRLGKRVYRPRLQVCFGSHPECYASAKVDAKGNALFQRGCTVKDICDGDAPEGLEYCKTCKSQFCNYDVMNIDVEYLDN